MNKLSTKNSMLRWAIAPIALLSLVACEEGLKSSGGSEPNTPTVAKKFTESDVEAPEIFQQTSKGLWDGRPSLGGVWVAHPSVKEPERVIIRNQANGKFVIGALFRKSSGTPGPAFQVSSDAASAISMQAGTPVSLSVTAMRLEKREVIDKNAPKPAPADDIASTALEALESGKPTKPKSKEILVPKVKPKTPKAKASKISAKTPVPTAPSTPKVAPTGAPVKFVQMGLFSIKPNAESTLANLKKKGVEGKIVTSSAKGKPFYRVLAGPATNTAEQSKILKIVKGMGFKDAYLVKG